MKFYGRDSNLTYNDQNIFHEGNKPSWNLKINNDSAGQQVSAGDAVTIKKGNGINITRSGSDVTISNTLAAGDGLALTGTNFKAVAGLGMLVNSSGIHTIFGGNGIENSSARSDHNHDEKYDNYGGFNIKVNSEATGQKIDSNADINIIGAGATTVSRNGNAITINSKDTIYTHPTSAGNKHIPSGGEANNEFQPADHDHPYLPLTGGTLTGSLIATDSISSRSTNGGAVEIFLSRENSGNRSWRFRNESGTFTIDNKLTSDETWTNSLQIKTGELTELYVGGTKVSKVGHTHDYAPSNHTHGYDNYGGYFIKNASETGTGQYIASGETVSFKAGNNITVSRNGREISIAATTPTASQVGAVSAKGDIVAGRVAIFNDTTGNVKDSGFTIAKSVPSNAVFTDTNTWRDVVDNLVSTNVDKSLSANQGKVLKDLIDGKAAASHTHSYLPLSGGTLSGSLTKNGSGAGFIINNGTARTMVYSSTTVGEHIFGGNNNSGSEVIDYIRIGANKLKYQTGGNEYDIYHTGKKPTPSDIGAAASSHTHNYAGSSSAGGSANAAVKLATARSINGTKFDGTGDITTANWGTTRTLTIGNTGKSVNGGGNVSWSLSEIGALPLTGGTLSGRLTANGRISAPTAGSNWISGMTITNATIGISTQQKTDSYHPVLAVKTSGNHVANIGGLGDDFGFYGFKSGRTENATDWSFKINAGTGAVSSTGNITAPTFVGALSCNASTATKATQDSAGQQINKTYIKGLSVSGKTITYTKGDGTTGTITTQDTNTTYSVGTASALGLTKLYTGTGTATDGTMTQAAINTALTSHTHKYAGSSSAGGAANTAVKLATARTITLKGVVTGSTSFDGSGNVTITTSANDITAINKSLKVTTDWMDTGIAGTNLSDGTYAVQVYVHDGTTRFNEYYSGTMSWYSGTISSSVQSGGNHTGGSNYLRGTNIQSCEILLHNAGQSSTLTDNTHIYLRTLRVSGASLKLQIASATAFSAAISVIFRFKKLI